MIKTLMAITLLFASGAVALAKHTPVEGPRLALVNADINSGSVLCVSGIILKRKRRSMPTDGSRVCLIKRASPSRAAKESDGRAVGSLRAPEDRRLNARSNNWLDIFVRII